MTLHKRTLMVNKVRSSVQLMFLKETEILTDGEVISLIGGMLSSMSKWMIREERHPDDPEKPGDLE